jgi:hypothetical protein
MENTLHVYAQSVEEAITAAVQHNVQRINQQLNEFGYCQLEYVRPLGEEVKRRIKDSTNSWIGSWSLKARITPPNC